MEEAKEFKRQLPAGLRSFANFAPCPVYVVGGSVRNFFCGLGKTDIDLAGAAMPAELGLKYRVVSEKLGTALLYIGEDIYEYTPLRRESYCGGRHTPVKVEFIDDIAADALRRDFTAGSIYYDVKDEIFIDPLGGIGDARRKILRAYNPAFTFGSDGLRLLRLARIAAETGFEIDAATKAAAQANASLLSDISPERMQKELDYVLNADFRYGVGEAHYRGLQLITELGLWNYFVPEIESMRDFPQNPKYHKYNVMEHSFQAVRFAQPEVRLAALLHDVAKPFCQLRDGNMHQHHLESARMTGAILKRLKYPTATVEFTARLVALHMYDLKGNASEAKVRLFVADNMDIIDDLVKLIYADGRATGMDYPERVHRFTAVKEEILADGAPYRLQMLAIKGDELRKLGYAGHEIGDELAELRRYCIFDPALNNRVWLVIQAEKDLVRRRQNESK